MKAIIWTKDNCPFCKLAKEELRLREIEYEERNIQQTWTKTQLLDILPNAKTVPQIFIDQTYVGGYTDLVEYFNSN